MKIAYQKQLPDYKNLKKTTAKELKEAGYIASLVQKARKKNRLAIRSLYELFAKEMLATSLRITNNQSDSEDVLQEAFLTSFEKIDQLKDDSKYGGWLKQIVINSSLKLVKSRVDYASMKEVNILEEEEPEHHCYEGISFDQIKAQIQKLPDGCREVFSLYLLEDFKHKEIAEMLGIAVSTSKSQYRYALKLLKEKLTARIYE